MGRASWIPVLALALAACDEGAAEEPAVARASDAIVGGEAEAGRPAVVAILAPNWEGDTLVCSGVLITPTIVVTAAHCLHPQVIGVGVDDLVVAFGSDALTTPDRIDVELGAYHPNYRPSDPDPRDDVGALRLVLPAPVDPIPLGSVPAVGEPVLLVGFGSLAGEGLGSTLSGLKRSGGAEVGEIGDSWFRVDRAPATTCTGDSGGATLALVSGLEVLVGVHSKGDCATATWNERIDVHADGFLKSFLGTYGGCGADGACALGCPGPDPDCPCAADDACNDACGEADPDCAGEGDACSGGPDVDGSEDGGADDGGEACGEARSAPPPGGGWGAAGCGVARGRGGRSAGALLALAVLSSLACRRRGARGGSSRSGS